jgi:hypothetical protein
MVAAAIRTVFTHENQEAARRQWRQVADGLRARFAPACPAMAAAAAIVRPVGALLLEQNSLETLAAFGHSDQLRLPAAAA